MRHTKYILTLVALFAISACTIADIDNQVAVGGGVSGDKIQVLGRMTRFSDVDVTTRGVKNEDEAKLTSMALALFPVKDDGTGLDGNCVYYQYSANQQELLFSIERGSNYPYNKPYVMYVFVNMPGMEDFGIGSTLEAMMKAAYDVENIDIPTNGFPMMGSLGDTFSTTFDKDNKKFILSPTDANGHLVAPTVGGETSNLLTIPMKAMYAKVNFTIEVRPDQQIEGNYSPQFTFSGYSVNNVPATVDFTNVTRSDNGVGALITGCSRPVTGNTVASGANRVNFTFYLPEQLLTPKTSSADYDYPFKEDGQIRGQDSIYMQRYKCKLLGDDQKAANIVISGTFRDHQNHYWDVDYTIYLGEDNYGDFNVKRNCEYNNYITIRGIQSSSDMSDNQNAISIDHRVNVTRTQPAIISLRRETLLDSHFEVRPLRIRKSEVENIGDINAVKVEVVEPETTNWMRIERSFGDGTIETANVRLNGNNESIYITDSNSPSYGKRRYFTYDLVNGTVATNYPLTESTEVVVPITEADETVWIYVDECTEVGDAVRAGIVKVSYGILNGSTFTPANNASYPDVSYIINQRKLFKVTYDDPKTTEVENRTYHIEYEEEYLHNFDADDNFGATEYEGMQWGLDGVQLSYDLRALYFGNSNAGWLASIINAVVNAVTSNIGVNPVYDFYIPKHDTGVSTLATKRGFNGYVFSTEIIQEVNGSSGNNTNTSDNIDILALNQQPKSAIEYCYNKNKRNLEGHVVWEDSSSSTGYNQTQLNWYMPAIDEMEDIVMSNYGEGLYAYARFMDFQDKFYWSSQPSYVRNFARYEITGQNGEFYYDDTTHARSTRVWRDVNGNKFDYAYSGATSYYTALRIYTDNWWEAFDPKYEVLFTGTYQGHTLGLIVREAGNRPRTSFARVRCVRKMN